MFLELNICVFAICMYFPVFLFFSGGKSSVDRLVFTGSVLSLSLANKVSSFSSSDVVQ